MSTRTRKNPAEAAKESAAALQEAESAETVTKGTEDAEKERKREEQLKAFLDKLPDPVVYCGPSVRNVTRQYTVYTGGIPDALKQFIMEHPAAKGLLVSVDRFAQTRIELETKGTAKSILFRKVLEGL